MQGNIHFYYRKGISMSQYVMTVVNENIVVKSGNLSETYSLTRQPPKTSLLVKEEKQALLEQVNLQQLLRNLDFCVDFLQIAYNAVIGMKGLHASVSDLPIRLEDDLILSNEAIQRSCYKTDSIISKFLDAYGYFISGGEDIALEILAEVKEEATEMRQDNERLATRFADTANRTEVVLRETINSNTQSYSERDATMEEISRITAEAATFEALKRNLEASIQDLNAEYNAFLKQQAQTEERTFALQLTGQILGGLGIVAQPAGEMQNVQNQNALQEYAKKYDARLAEIGALRKELERQERESLKKLAEYTGKISNAVIGKDALETATASLMAATGCLRKAVSSGKDMAAFWKSIEACCASLRGGDIGISLEHLVRKYHTLPSTSENMAQRVQPYKEIGVMRVFLGYLVRWVALGEISKEYLEALQFMRSRLNEAIRDDERSRIHQWEKASMLASRLGNKINGQLNS
jgi:hypothetical protein